MKGGEVAEGEALDHASGVPEVVLAPSFVVLHERERIDENRLQQGGHRGLEARVSRARHQELLESLAHLYPHWAIFCLEHGDSNQVLELRVALDGADGGFVVLEDELVHEGEELVDDGPDADDLHEDLADLLCHLIVVSIGVLLGGPLALIRTLTSGLLHALLLLGEPFGVSFGLHVLERFASLLLDLQGEPGNEMDVP